MDHIRNREISLLESVGKEFNSGQMNLDIVLMNVFNIIRSHYNIERGLINIDHKDEVEISTTINYGYTTEDFERGLYKFGEGIIRSVMQTGHPAVIPDIRNEPGYVGINRTSITNRISFICMPLVIQNNVIGAISIELLNNSGRELEEESYMLTMISIMISQAVYNSMTIRTIERKSKKDISEEINNNYSCAVEEHLENETDCYISNAVRKVNQQSHNETLEDMIERFEKVIIISSLKTAKGNISRAAKNLGTTKRILGYKISKLGIDYRLFRKNEISD